MPTLSFEVEETYHADALIEVDKLINNLYDGEHGDTETVSMLLIFLTECAKDLDNIPDSVRKTYEEIISILNKRCLPPFKSPTQHAPDAGKAAKKRSGK